MRNDDTWRPRCSRPTSLVTPVRIDPNGLLGPTRSQARSSTWIRVAHGWYVKRELRPDVVEQRIVEQASRLPPDGAVTAWASLRWRGGGFFDGTDQGGRRILPVPLVMGPTGNLRLGPGAQISWEQCAPWEREVVAGIPCTTVRRSLFDEIRRRGSIRSGVVAADMAIAAGLLTAEELADYVGMRPAWTGVPMTRKVLPLIESRSESPQESLLRLVWTLDAGLPRPMCNYDVFSEDGAFLGRPDLLDPDAGLVGEYDGADHLREDRRQRDRTREERFRDHGLEYVTVVRGEINRPEQVVRRLRAAYDRACSNARPVRWKISDSP
jgi:hypothetical protein